MPQRRRHPRATLIWAESAGGAARLPPGAHHFVDGVAVLPVEVPRGELAGRDDAVGVAGAAHVVAAQRLESGATVEPAYNLGSQNGLSVKEIMDAMARVTGIPFTPVIGPRRAGDPDRIVATGELAARDLDWQNRYTVDEMVRTGWEARRAASA